jgi:hypothetical protein
MTKINQLLQETGLWRASSIDREYQKSCSTGYPLLDQQLPGGGWPVDGVTEILHDQYGIGEFRLLAPALARLSHEQSRWLLLVSPPYIPYPPALAQAGIDLTHILITQPKTRKDYLWVLEKSLASQSCSAVIAWPGNIHDKQVRRLQLASKEGNCWNILFRPEHAARNASPAELRVRVKGLHVSPLQESSAVELKVLKRRGGWESEPIRISFLDQLNQVTPDFRDLDVKKVAEKSYKKAEKPDLSDLPSFTAKHIVPSRATYEYQ